MIETEGQRKAWLKGRGQFETSQRRWQKKNKAHLAAYMRSYRAKKKKAGK